MVALILLALAGDAWCPCYVVGPPDIVLGSVGQQAVYVIRPGTAARYRVVLVPRVQVRGNPDDVGILVPTPSAPEFQTVGASVFNEGARLTAPLLRRRSTSSRGSGCGFSGSDDESFDADPTLLDDGTTVISQQTVGGFDVTVLAAQNSSALIEWLDENGYAHGVDDDSVLDEYVANGWVFTAMRRAVQEGDKRDRSFVWDTAPVAMSYDADELHYPMALAALSASTSDATKVLVYTIADQRMTFEGARTTYANRVSDFELRTIRLLGTIRREHNYLPLVNMADATLDEDWPNEAIFVG